MSMTDPVADYLTRIRNAQAASKRWVDIPASNLKNRISFVLKEEHFIRDYILIKDNKQNTLRVFLNYDFNNDPVIKGIQRISKPGRRVYADSGNLPRVLNGMGVAIITTSKGVISDKKAKRLNVGGEVLCQVW
ncbi:MAG: 30S ribosomal protein S8 [Candidatus Marinimicrobia bacterium]|nr:30S ribosomal protein S8 [Candidatus Neomarinimicrobiota bacterium]MBL7023063.1 30S ribosomal protein S8 [Candidatus Neomarinimicrobiota bacterium]MBL7109083.1 30S ribosomal protein S8 [Candidatus Neomarinimicrobiota bacterium]